MSVQPYNMLYCISYMINREAPITYLCLKETFIFSVFQPRLEGFFACLDIWTVFLDYLIGKVANARSDKLAEAEATVSRFVFDTSNILFCGIKMLFCGILWHCNLHCADLYSM